MTQTDAILDTLRGRGEAGLTPIEALKLFGCFRLAARVSDAKARLKPTEEIVTLRVTGDDGKSFARYVLRQRPAPATNLQTALRW